MQKRHESERQSTERDYPPGNAQQNKRRSSGTTNLPNLHRRQPFLTPKLLFCTASSSFARGPRRYTAFPLRWIVDQDQTSDARWKAHAVPVARRQFRRQGRQAGWNQRSCWQPADRRFLAILTAIFETLQWTTISGGASLGAIARLFTNLVVRQSPP